MTFLQRLFSYAADPSSDELKRIMMMNGGIFYHYPSSRTTHYIATNLPDVKMKALRGNEVIVTPNWITESLACGKLLDYKKYLLYTKQTSNQPRIQFGPSVASETGRTAQPTSHMHPDHHPKDIPPESGVKGQALDAKSDKFLSGMLIDLMPNPTRFVIIKFVNRLLKFNSCFSCLYSRGSND